MKVVGFYHSVKDIGNHESQFERVGDFTKIVSPIRVSYVPADSDAQVLEGENFIPLREGMLLGMNALVKSNNSHIELRSAFGDVYKLLKNSEFCLEDTSQGVSPVYYGTLNISSIEKNVIYSGGKYRTSCWITIEPGNYTIKRISSNKDLYINGNASITIYEFDKIGEKFEIVTLKPYQKCVLSFDITKPIEDRYVVEKLEDINQADASFQFENFQSNKKWRHFDKCIEQIQ